MRPLLPPKGWISFWCSKKKKNVIHKYKTKNYLKTKFHCQWQLFVGRILQVLWANNVPQARSLKPLNLSLESQCVIFTMLPTWSLNFLISSGRFRGPSWLWVTWSCPAETWSSLTSSNTFWPSWAGTTTCPPPGPIFSARQPSADRPDIESVRNGELQYRYVDSPAFYRFPFSLLVFTLHRRVSGENHSTGGEVLQRGRRWAQRVLHSGLRVFRQEVSLI